MPPSEGRGYFRDLSAAIIERINREVLQSGLEVSSFILCCDWVEDATVCGLDKILILQIRSTVFVPFYPCGSCNVSDSPILPETTAGGGVSLITDALIR